MGSDGFSVRSVATGREESGGRPRVFRTGPSRIGRVPPGKRQGPRGNPLARGLRYLRDLWRELGPVRFLARGAALIGLLLVFYVSYLWFTLPNLRDPYNSLFAAAQSTTITDRNGIELYRVYGEQDRRIVAFDQISDWMKKAIVAIEDRRFYQHGCVDMRGIVRAVFVNTLSASYSQGFSTLEQQLARNALLATREKSLSRKIKEIMLACDLERIYTKEQILSLYLNWVPFGQNAYGVEQASRKYFDKSAKDLTLAEAALLASLPQSPSYFRVNGSHVHTSVTDDAQRKIQAGQITSSAQIADRDVKIGLLGTTVGSGSTSVYVGGRSDQVLQNMLQEKMITEEQKQTALEELKKMAFHASTDSLRAPHFVLWMKDQAEQMFQDTQDKGLLERGGLTIQTTLDWKLQQIAEQVVAAHRADNLKRFGAHNVGLIALDPHTREILAYVGNVDYSDTATGGKIDMVQAPRQPGSSFKPFVYASAFEKGYGPATPLFDIPTKFGDYQPQNYEGGFWGLMNARSALGGSRNIPAVKAYFLGGEEDTILDLADRMGVTTPKKLKPSQGYGPSLAIGAAETPLIEMAQGYSTFADGGRFKPAVSIRKMTDNRGNLLPLPVDFNPDAQGEQILDPRIAYQVTSILSDVSVRPGDYWKNILSVPGYQAAAKTGTSNKCLERDAKQNCKKRKPDNVWTMGYTPDLLTGVWVGNASDDAMSDSADGVNVAAPIWKDFMVKAHKLLKPAVQNFTQPEGMVTPQISLLSGSLPSECTPVSQRRADLFLAERAPTDSDPGCVSLQVDKVTGLLASDSCPVEARENRSFFAPHEPSPPSRALAAQWEQAILAWAQGGGVAAPDAAPAGGSGAHLPLALAPTQKCDMSLTPGRLILPKVTIVAPAPGGGAFYPSFQAKIRYSVGSGDAKQVEYQIDGKSVAVLTQAPFEGAITVPRSIAKEGSHTLHVILTDQYYNTAEDAASFSFESDSQGPQLTLTQPTNGAVVSSASGLRLRAEASDPEGGIRYVEFYLDDVLLTRKPQEPYQLIYRGAVAPGLHVIRAVATDLAGNVSQDTVQVTAQ